MTSLPPPRILVYASLACVFLRLDVHAQEAPSDDFASRLELAYGAGDSAAVGAIIAENRLAVKPAVLGLLRESTEAELAGDADRAAAKRDGAAAAAAIFESTFGERSLREAVSDFERWSPDEKRAKLHADSLLAHGRELRSGEEAYGAYLSALEIYRSIGDRLGIAEVLGGLGVVHWYGGNADSIVAYFEQALEARRAVDDRQLVGNSLNDLGLVSRGFLRDNEAALDYLLRSAKIREEIGDLGALVRTHMAIGAVYSDLGDPERAVFHLDQAAEQGLLVGDSSRAADALYRNGVNLSNSGRYADALDRFERSLDLYDPNDPGVAPVLDQIGVVYRRLGDYEAAIEKYQQVMRLAEAAADSSQLAGTLTNAGITLQWAGRFEQSARYYERALDIFEELGESAGRLDVLINLGSVHQDLKAYDASEPFLKEALALSRELNDPLREARSILLLGNLQNLSRSGDFGAAYYEQGLEIARKIASPELEWAAMMGVGERLERAGDLEAAVDQYLEALDTAETLRGGLQLGDDKAKFIAQKRFAYENVVHLLGLLHEQEPNSGHDRRAFEIAEQGKARAFLDLLTESFAEVEEGIDSELLDRKEALLDEMGQAQQALQLAVSSGEAERSEIEAIHDSLDELDEQYQSLQREIRRANPAYARLSDPDIARLEDVQRGLLSDGGVLLQYALGDSSSSLWAVTREDVRMLRLPPRDALQEQIEILRYALTRPNTAAVEAFATPARRLYEILLEPVEDLFGGGEEVVIVPDDALHYLPFDVLLTSSTTEGSFSDLPYLARTNATSYGHSASVLLQLESAREPRTHAKQLLALGDPDFGFLEGNTAANAPENSLRAGLARLPYSGTEVQAIADVFTDANADIFVRAEADEDKLKRPDFLRRYRFLHFATHGLVDERRPDFSGLVLSQSDAGKEDGFLQAAEIFDLDIDADLVVLSACETGLGEMVRGEGLVGLTRAFMYAGAPSILVSLWKVSDVSTSVLMEQFYGRMIGDGRSKSVALQQAKLEMIEGESHAHPFHWAPFVLIGNNN